MLKNIANYLKNKDFHIFKEIKEEEERRTIGFATNIENENVTML